MDLSNCTKFEFLEAVRIECVSTQFSRYHLPAGTCCFHFQGVKLFCPEGGSNRVFRNFSIYIPNCTASFPTRPLLGFGHFMIGIVTDLPLLDYMRENSTYFSP
jgi:hypothetical protein